MHANTGYCKKRDGKKMLKEKKFVKTDKIKKKIFKRIFSGHSEKLLKDKYIDVADMLVCSHALLIATKFFRKAMLVILMKEK